MGFQVPKFVIILLFIVATSASVDLLKCGSCTEAGMVYCISNFTEWNETCWQDMIPDMLDFCEQLLSETCEELNGDTNIKLEDDRILIPTTKIVLDAEAATTSIENVFPSFVENHEMCKIKFASCVDRQRFLLEENWTLQQQQQKSISNLSNAKSASALCQFQIGSIQSVLDTYVAQLKSLDDQVQGCGLLHSSAVAALHECQTELQFERIECKDCFDAVEVFQSNKDYVVNDTTLEPQLESLLQACNSPSNATDNYLLTHGYVGLVTYILTSGQWMLIMCFLRRRLVTGGRADQLTSEIEMTNIQNITENVEIAEFVTIDLEG